MSNVINAYLARFSQGCQKISKPKNYPSFIHEENGCSRVRIVFVFLNDDTSFHRKGWTKGIY